MRKFMQKFEDSRNRRIPFRTHLAAIAIFILSQAAYLRKSRDFGWRDSRLGDTEEEKNELLFDRPAIYG